MMSLPDIKEDIFERKVACCGCGSSLWASSYRQGITLLCDDCNTEFNSKSEEFLISQWTPVIEEHFHIDKEVWGTHFSGERVRVDMVIRPKNLQDWKNKNAAFAVEWKSRDKMDGSAKNTCRWFAQCIDYSNVKWDRYGWIYVLIGGGITPYSARSKQNDFQYLPRVASLMGVGELKRDTTQGLSIVMATEHRIWTEAEGVIVGKTHGLIRSWGSK